MRPPATIARRMRVAGLIRMRMMDAMRRNPLNRATFDRQHATGHEEIFSQFRHFVTTMSDKPMKAHADAKTAGNPVKNDCADHRRPAPEKESCYGGRVGDNEESSSAPVDVSPLPRQTRFNMFLVIHQEYSQLNCFRPIECDSNSAIECCPCKLANSTRPFSNARVTSRVRSVVSRPGITSARNVSCIPNAGLGPVVGGFLLARRVSGMSMNEPPHTVRKQNVHFLWFYERRHFALAKRRMHKGLSFAISSRPIVGRACLDRGSPSCAFLIWNPRPAYRAAYPSDPSLCSNRSADVASLFVACHAHLFHSISGFDNLYLFHVAPLVNAIC